MKSIPKIAIAAMLALGAATVSTTPAWAACDRDASTETVLGAGSGALVGGLASHSVVGAAVGGVAGGLIGNSIGHANNREDCRREARDYDRERAYERERLAYEDRARDERPPDGYIGHDGRVREYPDRGATVDYPDDD
jgi:hypothetical protein